MLRWIIFRFLNLIKRIYICFFFYIYLFDARFGVASCLKLLFLLYSLIFFYNHFVEAPWPRGLLLVQFTVIIFFFVFVLEFALYRSSVYFYGTFLNKLLFFLIILLLFYLMVAYFSRPAWSVCILLNFFINFICSSIFRSLGIFPNIFSIFLSRYLVVLKAFIYCFSYVIVLFLYLLSIRKVLTVVDSIILYINPIASFLQSIFS